MAYQVKRGDTNVELVNKFMENASPLNQAFLIQAVGQLAAKVVEQKEELLKQENSFVSMPAWIKCAEDWIACEKERE